MPSLYRLPDSRLRVFATSHTEGRAATQAEQRARCRSGVRSDPGVINPVWATIRNGLPGVAPYTWRPGEQAREAEVQARLAAVRAGLAAQDGAP